MNNHLLRNIPSVNEFFEEERISKLVENNGRYIVKEFIVSCIEQYRNKVIADNLDREMDSFTKEAVMQMIVSDVVEGIRLIQRKRLRKVINATGVILHTNMGRAPLPKKAVEKISDVASGYSNLEYDLDTGRRGSRYESVEALLRKITGAESAMVVNNNAAAVFLCLNSLAGDKEVVVSRSEQVEIGGSFRIPEIVERSGARMVEVGTTNKTYIRDYDNAISEDTGILLKVHKSNYRIEGFTHEVEGEALADLGKQRQVITMEDLGSGVLFDLQQFHLPYEPTVMDQVNKGLDIITFSGDKLLGGPQAGIIVGKKVFIDRIKKNPLTRMVRIDKLSLIALQEVLSLYTKGDQMIENIPILAMLSKSLSDLQEDASCLKTLILEKLGNTVEVNITQEEDSAGGGSLPGITIEGVALKIRCKHKRASMVQTKLRDWNVPIIGKIKDDSIILSMRTMDREDFDSIVNGLDYAVNQ